MKKRTIQIALLSLALAVVIPLMAFANRMVNILTSYQYISEGHIMSSEERAEYLASEADDTLSNSSAQEIEDANAQFEAFLKENSEVLQCDELGITNILLIGCDSEDYQGYIRSDSMILLSINQTQNTIKMVSLMRDMRVFIPHYSYYDKLNAALAYDSSGQLLLDTLEYNFKLTVDKFVMINYKAFAEVVDLLGGINVSVKPDYVDAINQSIANPAEWLESGGIQTLNGNQSLAFCRMRMVDSDVQRTARQRDFLTAMLRRLMRSTPQELISAIEVTMPNVMTNMTFGELVTLASNAAAADASSISQLRIPADGTWYDLVENQIMYIGFNGKKNVALLHEFLYADAEEAAALAASASDAQYAQISATDVSVTE